MPAVGAQLKALRQSAELLTPIPSEAILWK